LKKDLRGIALLFVGERKKSGPRLRSGSRAERPAAFHNGETGAENKLALGSKARFASSEIIRSRGKMAQSRIRIG